MKYIEQIKSILLTFLVLLSITFTLLIWNYKPAYEITGETQVEEVLVGQPKQLQEVLKPYRLLYHQDNQFYGTVSPKAFNELYSYFTTWQTENLELINSKISDEKINELIRTNNRATLFFNEEIPLQVFSDILTIADKETSDTSFNRLILDWSNMETSGQIQLLFLNTEKRILMRGVAAVADVNKFKEEVIAPVVDYSTYVEIERDATRSLYVAENPIPAIRYTYFIYEIYPDKFKKVVFTDPRIVQSNKENNQSERLTDGTSLMTVDKRNHIINYVYPTAESIVPIPPFKLLDDSFDYVNEHGGFTADYRFYSMDVDKHIVEYQLYLHGLPIYSSRTTTKIVTTWGENRIYSYRRPYYLIEEGFEQNQKILAPGEEVVANIRKMADYPLEEIDEVVVGYYLTQDEEQDFFILEPSWFAIKNNVFTRLVPERAEGDENGLE